MIAGNMSHQNSDTQPRSVGGLRQTARAATIMVLILTAITGIAYPLAMTGIAQAVFPRQAAGSIIERDGSAVGSRLIGQATFGVPAYLWSRPSAAGAGYDAMASGGSNLSPASEVLIDEISSRVETIRRAHPERAGVAIPSDLVTASGSGLDPEVSPAAAEYQVPRLARERDMSEEAVRDIIERATSGRTLGIIGERRVNVLAVNLDLDAGNGR